jgi:photosystem II stability/assembly factor-like uncharacterized protein
MKVYTSVLIYVLLCWALNSSAEASWERVSFPEGVDLFGVDFIDELRGWCVGAEGLIVNTMDGGKTWHRQGSGTNQDLYDIYFANPNVGWAVGDGGTILHTENGGVTWVPVPSPTERALYAISFPDGQNGWIVGSLGTILHTSDGGKSWTEQFATRMTLQDVRFIDERTGWAVGIGGVIIHTSDGGASWKVQDSGTEDFLYGVRFISQRRGWAVGDDGVILVTSDGGETWRRQNPGGGWMLKDVHFANSSLGWAVGEEGVILKTMNGGENWRREEVDLSVKLNALDQGGTFLWTVGNGGTVLREKNIPVPETLVEITGELDEAISMPKEPTIKFASIRVNSTPRKASIILDGKPTGKKTPATLEELIPGRHEVKVVMRNRGTVTKIVTVKEGEMKTVNLNLPTRNRQISILAGGIVIGGITFAVLQFFAGGF